MGSFVIHHEGPDHADAHDLRPARHVPTFPLRLDATAASRRRDLSAARRVSPLRLATTAGPCGPATAARIAREAVADRRSSSARALDLVADRLMAELGW